jgi:sodium-dependent dicarboxylate transporter 2/3/5
METSPDFDRLRRTAGLLLGPVVFLIVLALPTGLPVEAHRLAAVFALVVVFWVSEAIPLAATALLGPALAVALGVAPAKSAFASFGHPIIFLFIGSFLISGAMIVHGLDRRIALFVLSRAWVGNRPTRILLAFGAIAAFLSMWMSNTATTAMMLPIGLGVLRTLSDRRDDSGDWPYATGLMLMIAFSCNVGGIATPVGSPPNLIAIGLIEEILGRSISFFEWMSFGLPIAVVLFGFLYFLLRWMFAARLPAIEGAMEVIREERAAHGGWSNGERVALGSFLLAVALWTLPGLVSVVLGSASPLAIHLKALLPEGASAILAATLLFVVPVNWKARRFALDWNQAARIDWGTILLFGGGLSLGGLAFKSGLAAALGSGIEGFSVGLPVALIALLALYAGDFMTEVMSNTATANLLIPIFLVLAASTGEASILPALAATLGCSLAFCFPVATPPNAIVYGSGHVRLPQMIRAGLVLDLVCGLLAWAVLLLLV